jgi:siroheme synthase-like protein
MAGVRCLIVGGGRIASRKAMTLLHAGAEVVVLAPTISAELRKPVHAGQIAWIKDKYKTSLIGDFRFVVAATSDEKINRRIAADTEKQGILSCNVSSAENSRVIFPAILEEKGTVLSVHSHGRNCRRSQSLRNEIAQWLERRKSK